MPDRAVLVYANKVRALFPGVPIVLGGIEASLRRFAHYDYWENKVRRSLLLDSRADILVYGPGELQAVEIARRLERGEDLDGVRGTCVVRRELPPEFEAIPSYEDVAAGPEAFCAAQNAFSNSRALAQKHAERYVLQYPMPDYTTADLDWVYGLPFSRNVPADFPEFKMAQFSVVTHRGCFGRCSFCSIALHQGDRIVSRSEDSILDEIQRLTKHPDFKGYIDDLGGPTANMYGMDCELREGCGNACLGCGNLDRDHRRLIDLMRKARAVPGVKKVFVRSGIRHDLAMESEEYLRELSEHHVSGLLKIAPEHVSPGVLRLMNKDAPPLEEFRRAFKKASGGRKQHLKYYFMVAHPGSGPRGSRGAGPGDPAPGEGRGEAGRGRPDLHPDADDGLDVHVPYGHWIPISGEKVYVPRTFAEKKEQKRILQK